MFAFKISVSGKSARIKNELHSLLSALYKNGQIYRNYEVLESNEKYFAIVLCPEEDSLNINNYNYHAKKTLNVFKRETKINIEFIGVNSECSEHKAEKCCGKTTFYILYTHLFSEESPLRCGDCFAIIPLYKITKDEKEEYCDILSWMENYKACDTLYINSSTGEDFSLKELSTIESSLTQQGIDICRNIEQRTGVKVYYYLQNHSNTTLNEDKEKKCPGCGNKCLLKEPLFNIFKFKCDDCRLLSNLSSDLED